MRSWWTTFLDLVYPPKCPGCKVAVDEQGAWCASCHTKISGVRSISMVEHKLVSLDSCWTVCEYTGSLKRMIHDMKFRRQRRYAVYLQWLVGRMITGGMFDSIDYVIPVPLHEKRLEERGYNQTEAIFHELFKEAAIESIEQLRNKNLNPGALVEGRRWMPKLLVRTRYTIPQWELKLPQRKANIKDAFSAIHPEIITNKQILLVDDIFTTGITLDECAKVLKKAGASRVYALVVASGAH